jgi:replicative DNA helicase
VRLPMIVCIDYLDVWLDDLGPERVIEAERAAAALKHQLALGAAFSGIDGLSRSWRPLVLLNVQAKLPDPDHKTGALRAPTGNDIAWCRAVKNHCDVNLMIHRPWMAAHPDNEEAYVVVEKHRFGRAGTARLRFADGLFSNPGDGPTWRGYTDGYAIAEISD